MQSIVSLPSLTLEVPLHCVQCLLLKVLKRSRIIKYVDSYFTADYLQYLALTECFHKIHLFPPQTKQPRAPVQTNNVIVNHGVIMKSVTKALYFPRDT